MKNKNQDITVLDCTLRDGGYHNNWNFNKKVVQDYLLVISKLNIDFVELGFRFLEKDKIKGPTAYTTDSFIKSIRIPSNIKIGIMVNASDLITNKSTPLNNCKKLFQNLKKSKVKFVRFACHHDEVFHLRECISWLKKNHIIVCINIMQISEIKEKKIKNICNFLNQTKIDVLYIADSLGSLNPKTVKVLIKKFKKYWKKDLGLHAHNNLNLAKTNAIIANRNGVKWIDSTVTGMGRGPGNLKTEDILQFLKVKKNLRLILHKLINKHFLKLKKEYKWGPNKYYALAARNKIHPTYIQKLLSDSRYKEKDYFNIIDFLKKSDAKKFNPYKLINSSYLLSSSPKGNWKPKKILQNKNILILGSGGSALKYKNKIKNFIIKNNLFVMCLNTVDIIENKLINLRVACHPMRILSDISFHKKSRTKLVLPYSTMSKKMRNSISLNRDNILDYGLSLNFDEKINIRNNYCTLPYPLAVGYSLSIAIAGSAKKVYFAGFDGFKNTDPNKDNTSQILESFRKKFFKRKLLSLTPTNYHSSLKFIRN